MIPILYDSSETRFASNGLGRLRDCISAQVVEERNSIYELDFQYPVTGANYDLIKLGRIVGVVTDDTGDFQPFDIVSFSKPIDGVVTFHCVHISYRQSYMTATGSSINSLSDAFDLLATAEPSNPFTYWTDKTSSAYMAAADGKPRSVRQLLGGVDGSILDTYGGEYEWDKFTVKLWSARGRIRDFTIRYGVNMLEYNDDMNAQGTYSSCVPFWTNGETTIIGDRVDSSGSTVTGRGECVPLDLSDKFESEPTQAQVEAMAESMMNGNNTYLPTQTITVSFVRLQDMDEYAGFSNLLQCGLCDTIKVIFPDYGTSGQFKIVKTVWDVLMDRYESMELGTLSTTLSEALGINNSLSSGGGGGGTSGPIETRTLLWTNSGNTYGTGTVPIDLSDYDDVEILAAGFQTSNYVYSRCPVGKDGLIQCFTTSPDNTSNASTFMNTATRHYTTSTSGITFDNGQMTYAGGVYRNWDSRAVPLKIYGIKYVG